MQQHLMQQNPLMAYATHPGGVTTDLIQQYLDENKQLILAILDNQSSGKVGECAANQAKLQRNLMYLAAIADSQPQMPTIPQSGTRYLQPQQTQQMTPESIIAARSSMLYAQASLSTLQQQQQQQQALHGQPGMTSAGHTGLQMLYGDAGIGGRGSLPAGSFPDFALNRTTSKQEMGNASSSEGKGGNPGGQSSDGAEPLYMKGSEGGGS